MIQAGLLGQGRARQRARPDVQGELPRPAQLEGDRRDPRAARATASRCTCTTRWPSATEARHEYGVELVPWEQLPTRQRHRRRGGAQASSPSVRSTRCSPSCPPGGVYVDVKCTADAAGAARTGRQRLAAVTTARRRARCDAARASRGRAAGWSPAAPASSARTCSRRCCAPARRVVSLDNFATGHRRNLDEVRAAVGEAAWARHRFIEGDIADAEVCRRACEGVDLVLHQAALGSVPRSIDDPLAHAPRQRDRLSQHAGRRARRRRRALRLCGVELDLRRFARRCPRSRTPSAGRCRPMR